MVKNGETYEVDRTWIINGNFLALTEVTPLDETQFPNTNFGLFEELELLALLDTHSLDILKLSIQLLSQKKFP